MNKELENKIFTFSNNKSSVELLYDDESISIASIDIMHEDETLEDCDRNLCNFSHNVVVDAIDTFYNRPIIYRLNDLENDVTSHAKSKKDILNTRIAGHIPTDSKITFVKRDNGKTYCNVEAVIQKRYLPVLMNIIEERDGKLDVSIEVSADGYQDVDTGIYVVEKFKLLGICLLGEGIAPGMEGANMEMLSFSEEDDIESLNKQYMVFSRNKTNIIEKIKYKQNFAKGGIMEHRELERRLWAVLSKKTYLRETGWECCKYDVEAIYDTHIVVKDNETGEYIKMKYEIVDDNVIVDFDDIKVIEEFKFFEAENFAKEDIGTKPAIKLNKKELKETPWGQIDKSKLRERVIAAKNFKTIAPDIFLDLREGWEEGKMGALKYPVMEIEGDTAYYNRGALTSAKGYAEKNNEQEVLDKLKKIYNKLGLEFEEKDEGDKVMMSCETIEPEIKDMEKEPENKDLQTEENMEQKDMDCKSEDMEEKSEDIKEMEKDEDEVKEPDAGAQEDKDEEDAKDDEEVRDDDVKDDIKEMSTDANVDASAAVAIEEKQAEDNKDLAKEENPSLEKVDLNKEIEDLKLQLEEKDKELDSLRTFKKETEDRERDSRVAILMNEVKDIVPEDIKDEFLEKSKEFSLENINEWENLLKAKAFEYAGNKVNTNKNKNFTRMGIWGNEKPTKQKRGLWDF